MSRWTLAAVEKAAPDASSLAAARKLALPGPWSDTGSTEHLVWGKCQGSGKTPYQVSIDLNGPAYRCSCPSRKFPCKHALALLMLWVRGDGSVATLGEPADFAGQWAAERTARAASKAPAKAVDPEARAKRQQERFATMSAGMADFGQWLGDLAQGGLAAARRQDRAWWERTAARLVDAQLPGLAEQVRRAQRAATTREDWAEHLLVEAGRWWSAVRAWEQWHALPEATRGDLRTLVGWAWAREDVLASDRVTGEWQVLGAHRSEDGRLQEQRTWLAGRESGEVVQLLDFAAGGESLPVPQLTGSIIRATLARYPGSGPRRATFADEPVALGERAPLPAGGRVDDALADLAAMWEQNPWGLRVPVAVRGRLLPEGVVVDESGAAMPVVDGSWELLAATGGHLTDLFGEVEAAGFRPLTVQEVP